MAATDPAAAPNDETKGGSPMTTDPNAGRTRHPAHFREDQTPMFQAEFRLAEVQERQERLRAEAERNRLWRRPRRGVRQRIGESLVRLGRRIGGDTVTTPAWQG